MYKKTDKKYIYWIIELFLSKKIEKENFCENFHDSYGLETDSENFNDKEEQALDDLHQVVRRFSSSKEDLKSSGFFYNEKELRDKVQETYDKLGSLDELINRQLKIPDQHIFKSATILDKTWLMCPDCIDAWESTSKDTMVICPKCNQVLRNPRRDNENRTRKI